MRAKESITQITIFGWGVKPMSKRKTSKKKKVRRWPKGKVALKIHKQENIGWLPCLQKNMRPSIDKRVLEANLVNTRC
jgi:hypothetical protein